MVEKVAVFCRPILVLVAMAFLGLGGEVCAAGDYEHPGYLDDVADERHQVSHEIVILQPEEPAHPSVIGQIFTEKLSMEFSREFRRQFGYTEFEQVQMLNSRTVESMDSGRQLQISEYLEKQEAFGKYIAKELTEYHIDNYLRSHRSTRQIYEVKEKLSNIQVEAKNGIKYKVRYKLTTNRVQFRVEQPNEKFHKSLETKADGRETTVRLSYDWTKTVRLGSDLDVDREIYSLYAAKSLSPQLSTSVTGQTFAKTIDANTPEQDRILLGLSWND